MKVFGLSDTIEIIRPESVSEENNLVQGDLAATDHTSQLRLGNLAVSVMSAMLENNGEALVNDELKNSIHNRGLSMDRLNRVVESVLVDRGLIIREGDSAHVTELAMDYMNDNFNGIDQACEKVSSRQMRFPSARYVILDHVEITTSGNGDWYLKDDYQESVFSYLGEELDQPGENIGRRLYQCLEDGWVEYQYSGTSRDRRVTNIRLTEEGLAELEIIRAVYAPEIKQMEEADPLALDPEQFSDDMLDVTIEDKSKEINIMRNELGLGPVFGNLERLNEEIKDMTSESKIKIIEKLSSVQKSLEQQIDQKISV